jgi:hypothetical protein
MTVEYTSKRSVKRMYTTEVLIEPKYLYVLNARERWEPAIWHGTCARCTVLSKGKASREHRTKTKSTLFQLMFPTTFVRFDDNVIYQSFILVFICESRRPLPRYGLQTRVVVASCKPLGILIFILTQIHAGLDQLTWGVHTTNPISCDTQHSMTTFDAEELVTTPQLLTSPRLGQFS